jgi:nucleotide sugar dehydrogenase
VAIQRPIAIAVVGLGKIGLAIAAQYASKGHRVVGVDVDPEVVRSVNSGRTHVLGEPLLAERVSEAVSAGLMRATQDTSAAAALAEVVVVAVPLVVDADGAADFRAVDDATDKIGRAVRPGTVIIYETTLPLGTTRGRFGPAVEALSGLALGKDLFLAFSPERVSSGRVFKDLATYPKIVGGVDAQSTSKAAEFYSRVLDAEITRMDDAETAEYAKLAETTYRFVNIALADELALFGRRRGVNVAQAFAAANSQPYSRIHQPGIGVGGHCIPIYPRFLLEVATDGELSLVRRAHDVDKAMVGVYAEWLSERLGGLRGKRVLVLGVCYRADVREVAFSAAFPIVEELQGRGATTFVHDPLYALSELKDLGFEPLELGSSIFIDGVVIQAFHSAYRELDWGRFVGLKAVADGRGALPIDFLSRSNVSVISAIARSSSADSD